MDWKTLLNGERPRASTNPPGDHREEFERDFDRAIFSTPVKRLQDKAQVFPLDPHDAVRTRLTHSLEVSSVARGLGKAVSAWLLERGDIDPGMDRGIEAIAATAGLIHDLGNPPFGHSGEDAIREWFAERFGRGVLSTLLDFRDQLVDDFLVFEGNAQTLRLVAKLQILADYHGLNLTFGTLSASCKYLATSQEVKKQKDHAYDKLGYFASEADIVKQIRLKTGTGDARNPLTFLVEAADDIVYSAADIEDAVKKGILAWPHLKQEFMVVNDVSMQEALKRTDRILKAGRNEVPPGLDDDVYASAFRTAAIGVLVHSVIEAFKVHYDTIMAGGYTGELVKDCTAKPLISKLKTIGRTSIYCTPPNLKLELMGRKIITDLMNLFWEGAESLPLDEAPNPFVFSGKVGALLSANYRKVFQHFATSDKSLPEKYHRFQLVTDYVCGMTDSFAKRLHAELRNG